MELESLFAPGELRIRFQDGFLQKIPLSFQWINNAGGDFSVGTNWNDGIVPLASDSALWNLGSVGGYSVQFGTNVSTDGVNVKNDNVTFDLNGFSYSTSGLYSSESLVVGLEGGDVGQLEINGGAFFGTNARLASDTGARGTLIVNDNSSVDLSGSLIMGTGEAILRLQNAATARVEDTLTLGELSRIELQGGAVTVGTGLLNTTPNTAEVQMDGTLGGSGVVEGALVNNGRVDVGLPIGVLSINDDYTQQADGTLDIDIAGLMAGSEHDQLQVGGDAILAGELELAVNASLNFNNEVVLLTAGTVSGQFDTISGVTLAPDQSLAVLYQVDQVVGRVALPGDADLNGVVDGSDFGIWNANKFGIGTTWATGDFNGDGRTDGSDFGIWNANKFTSIDAASVPEPLGMYVVWQVLLAWACRRTQPFSRGAGF